MSEDRTRPHHDLPALEQLQIRVERDSAERDDDPDAPQRGELIVEMREALGNLFASRLVVRRRAAHGRGDVGVAEREAVIRMLRCRDIREATVMKRRHQEITGAADAIAGENAADNGGLRLALMSYIASLTPETRKTVDSFTPEQRFFVAYGQSWCENARPERERMLAQTNPHAPPRHRVNGVVSNMPEFAKAFSCKADAPMVRKNACRVW